MKKIAYLYVCDTMADWESSYVISELHSGRYFKDKTVKYEVKTVSLTQDPITTMGGLKILPDFWTLAIFRKRSISDSLSLKSSHGSKRISAQTT